MLEVGEPVNITVNTGQQDIKDLDVHFEITVNTKHQDLKEVGVLVTVTPSVHFNISQRQAPPQDLKEVGILLL